MRSGGSTPLGDESRSSVGSSIRVSSAPSSAVRVTVRVRPPMEGMRNGDECIQVSQEESTLTLDQGEGRPPRLMRFTSVHDRQTTQREFFERCGIIELLGAALDGYTSTVFAFGQTGSGKTFTMSGKAAESLAGRDPPRQLLGNADDQVGLMQRAATTLYNEIGERERKYGVKYTVRSTFLEIYNEQVHDLIEPRAGAALAVRGSSASGFYVEDLAVVQCRGLGDLEYVINKGLERRASRHHQLNQHSSRSHAVFSIYLDVTEEGADTPARYGRLSLLDLAGSENVRMSQSTGGGLKEAGQINKSLFALGQVIKTLSHSARSAGNHVPYRESCLTKLLCDSLGGNAHTLMIACCSPLTAYLEESMRTLHYACSAGAIRNRPVVKLDPQQQLIARLKAEVHELKQQVQFLTHELSHAQTRLAERGEDGEPATFSPSSNTPMDVFPRSWSASASLYDAAPQHGNERTASSCGAINSALSATPSGPRVVSVSLEAGAADMRVRTPTCNDSPCFRAPEAFADACVESTHASQTHLRGPCAPALSMASTNGGGINASNAAKTTRQREREASRHLDQLLAGFSAHNTQMASASLRAVARAPAEYEKKTSLRSALSRGRTPPRRRPASATASVGAGTTLDNARVRSLDPELDRWVRELQVNATSGLGTGGLAEPQGSTFVDDDLGSSRHAYTSGREDTSGASADHGYTSCYVSSCGSALVRRSERERDLERQLRVLSGFSIADSGARNGASQPSRSGTALSRKSHDRIDTARGAALLQAHGVTKSSQLDAHSAQSNARHAVSAIENDGDDVEAPSAADMNLKRSAREEELERSLRELAKFSIH